MKLAFLLVIGLSALQLRATTCIAGKKFKARQVCGTVTDRDGAVIPNAAIEIAAKQPNAMNSISSDQNGHFALPNAKSGEYEIRVKYSGFWDAWQPFTVSGSSGDSACTKPIHVVMVPAGGCSYVENAWNKESTKKPEARK